ncbi:MAG: hypothetical protein LBI31_05120 [Zoogloeaceae bacterium]|jgi:hypothetical protein|nr:hypothetical protein [Zoogloeaceae bacterium]
MSIRHRFLPLSVVEPDMVLARPLMLTDRGRVILSFPADHVLTQNNLEQLRARHAQYVCVQEEDNRGQMARERFETDQIDRLQIIFRHADMGDPETRAFFEAILAYRVS